MTKSTHGTPWSRAKRRIAALKPALIGANGALEAIGNPNWRCTNPTNPAGYFNNVDVEIKLLDPDALAAPAAYLTSQGALVSPVLEPLSDGTGVVNRLRYRQDRMLAAGDVAALDRAHRAIRAAAHLAVAVGELSPGECLLVDNGKVLHRRRNFTGRRVIRRLWFDEVR